MVTKYKDRKLQEIRQRACDAGIPRELGEKRVEYAHGASARSREWGTVSSTLAELFCSRFLEHKVGEKDGPAITQGALLNSNACERRATNAKQNFLVMLDFDAGDTLEEISNVIRERGLFAIVYTTHSHSKSTSTIAQKALQQFLKKSNEVLAADGSPELTEQCRRYLLQAKKYREHVFKTEIEVVKTAIEQIGAAYVVKHEPMVRARAVFVLEEPFDFYNRHQVAAEAQKEWSERYGGFSHSLNLSWDASCADPARLMYLPRHAHGTPHEVLVIPGRALRIDEMPRLETNKSKEKPAPKNKSRTLRKRVSEEPFKTRNLLSFVGQYGGSFEITDLMRELCYEERGPATGGGVSFACPNEHNHSDPTTGTTRFFVRDASQNDGNGFFIYCAGSSCKQTFARVGNEDRQDRAKWLDVICQSAGIADAMDLIEYCEADAGGEMPLPRGFKIEGDKILKGEEIVCDLVDIVGVARNSDSGCWGKIFAFINPDGVRKEVLVENEELHGDLGELAKRFAKEGLSIGIKAKNNFALLLATLKSDKRICRVSKPGFQTNGIFVPPVGEPIIPPDVTSPEHYVWVNSPSDFVKTAAGTFENWQRAAKMALSSTSPQVGLGLLLGTCGPMTHLLGLEPHGLFWSGPTSRGKSTAMIAQVGIWSNPEIGKGLRRAARTTTNGLEAYFESFNGTTGGIDDLQNGGEGLAQDAVYMASNGQGRQRLSRDAGSRAVRSWSGYSYALNAELTPSQLLNGKKTEVAGAYARCPVVDLSDAPLMSTQSYEEMLSLLQNNYGHAGPRIVQAFHNLKWHRDPSTLRSRYETALAELSHGMLSAQRRAATVFAMMAVMGNVMVDTGILLEGCDVSSCIEWGWKQVKRSEEFQKLAVEENAAERLLEWAIMSGEVYDIEGPIPAGRTPLAYRNRCENLLYLPESSLKKIEGLGSTPKAAITALKKSGGLVRNSDRWIWKSIPSGPRIKHYRINCLFEEDVSAPSGSGLEQAVLAASATPLRSSKTLEKPS